MTMYSYIPEQSRFMADNGLHCFSLQSLIPIYVAFALLVISQYRNNVFCIIGSPLQYKYKLLWITLKAQKQFRTCIQCQSSVVGGGHLHGRPSLNRLLYFFNIVISSILYCNNFNITMFTNHIQQYIKFKSAPSCFKSKL